MFARIALICSLAFFLAMESHAQSKKRRQKAEKEAAVQLPSSRDPAYTNKEYAPNASRKSSKGPTYGLEEEFYDRMEALAKERRKIERIMEKPQYSDPMYFGHKRPPKKRKPSKMKFCKECGIRH